MTIPHKKQTFPARQQFHSLKYWQESLDYFRHDKFFNLIKINLIFPIQQRRFENRFMQFKNSDASKTIQNIYSEPVRTMFNNHQQSIKFIMNEYSQSLYHPEEDSLFLEAFHPCIYGQEFKHSHSPISQQKNTIFDTNYIEVDPQDNTPTSRPFNSIDTSHQRRLNYVKIFKGNTTETMQLHHSFKTILSNFLKDLIILKILDKGEIKRCRDFFQSLPSFQSVFTLFANTNENSVLRNQTTKYFRSNNIIQKILESKTRIDQKKIMIKYIDKLRISIQFPTENRKWKKI